MTKNQKRLVGCDLFGISNELDSPVRQTLIQGVAFFGSPGRMYEMIIVGQLRVILVSFAS